MKLGQLLLVLLLLTLPVATYAADRVTVAAASSVRFALDEILIKFRAAHPHLNITVVYGSSGRLATQIINGAPYDIFFSADIAFPAKLYAAGFAVSQPEVYASGRIVIWSRKFDASVMTLKDLTAPAIRRIAIAQPAHAPYGMRAREAMKAAGVWAEVQPKLVFGDTIAMAAQMVQSEAAEVGIIARSHALSPGLVKHGYSLIDDSLHYPLNHGYVITSYGRHNPGAHAFARHMAGEYAKIIMEKHGFVVPIGK